MVNNETGPQANHDALINQVNQTENGGEKKKKGKLWKYILNISLVLIVTALAIFLTVKDNYKTIISLLASSNFVWIIVNNSNNSIVIVSISSCFINDNLAR